MLCCVAAWVRKSNDGQVLSHQVEVMGASSATMVEIKARLQVLHWFISNRITEVLASTDCAVFVQGLKIPKVANASIQTAFLDFCYLCTFLNYAKVVKVTRTDVKAAHYIARVAMLSL